MAIVDIPTGILLEEIVETLPQTGEENKVYRRLVEDEDLRALQITDDFIWYDGEWHPFSFDARICGAYFERYQQSVQETVAEMQSVIDEQSYLIQELEEAVFPTVTVSFDMSITSMIMTELDLINSYNEVVEANAFSTEIWESEPMTFQTELKKDHFYYLKNSDGYVLSYVSPSGATPVTLMTNGEEQINLGNVEIASFEPQYPQERGGKK